MSYETNYIVEGGCEYDPMGMLSGLLAVLAVVWIVVMAVSIVLLVAQWKLFKKAGRPGWAAIIPFYNTYTIFDIVYGEGIKFLFLLIPFFNIYVMIKLYIDLAHVYGKSTGFGIGLLLVSPVFFCMLGFGNARYLGTVNGKGGFAQEPVVRQTVSESGGMSDEDMRAALREKMQNR